MMTDGFSKEMVPPKAFARMYTHAAMKPLPAVISHHESGIIYIDRYELRLCPLLNMDVDGYTKMHTAGHITDERYQFGLELNRQLKELERMEYGWL